MNLSGTWHLAPAPGAADTSSGKPIFLSYASPFIFTPPRQSARLIPKS